MRNRTGLTSAVAPGALVRRGIVPGTVLRGPVVPATFVVGAVLAGLVLALLIGLPAAAAPGDTPPASALAARVPFTEVADQVGLGFVHFNGMTGQMYFPEMMGPAVALLDYDSDGDLDVYVLQGARLVGETAGGDAAAPTGDRLFRNDLPAGGPPDALAFTDVTDSANLPANGYGIGVAAGDYDNDGDTDLYLAQYGSNALLRNEGGGTFAQVTEEAGADDTRWSAAAAFVDFDRDGWLDLFVVNYVDFPVAQNPPCYAASSRRDYCGPASFPPTRDRLLRNRGDGTFEDVTATSGIGAKRGPGLGVVVTDSDLDGWPDLYVANDGAANFLWLNQKDGTFRDEALLAGAAVNAQGRAEAGMGVDADDFDNDGDEDIVLAHLVAESNTLYVHDGAGGYTDRSNASGLAAPSLPYTAFGTGWIDYDNDGWLDLVFTNGAARIIEELALAGEALPLHMPNQLFRNRRDGTFADVSAEAGPAFGASETSRATALGDLDNDGDVDVVVGNTAGPLRLLRNEVGSAARWIGLRLLDSSGRDALGARVELQRGEAPSLWRRAASDGSFAAANDPRVLAGLGGPGAPKLSGMRVLWPDGREERFPAPPEGRYTTLSQGTAAAATPDPATTDGEPRAGQAGEVPAGEDDDDGRSDDAAGTPVADERAAGRQGGERKGGEKEDGEKKGGGKGGPSPAGSALRPQEAPRSSSAAMTSAPSTDPSLRR